MYIYMVYICIWERCWLLLACCFTSPKPSPQVLKQHNESCKSPGPGAGGPGPGPRACGPMPKAQGPRPRAWVQGPGHWARTQRPFPLHSPWI